MTISTKLICAAACFGAGLMTASTVSLAEETKSSGYVSYQITDIGSLKLPNGNTAARNNLVGVIIDNDPNSNFHLGAQNCSGTGIVGTDGIPIEGVGSCGAVDKDGDVWWLWYHNKGNDRTYTVIGGTGKFEGMTGGGTTKVLNLTTDGRMTISWEGTFKMK